MSKNKLVWNIALVFLIAIISLPIAYAQIVSGGSQLYFLLINAAIIFVVLFILQAFLIPKKTEKETTSTWVIMILASLLLAYLFGRTGLLWAEGQPLSRFFSIYVLVNAIIIGAALYFVLGFVLKDKVPNSPQGMGGYGILIFLVAMVFAVKLGNQWIWNLATIIQFRDYLFGNEGILNPSGPAYRLWTFLVSATLLAFFFSGYLIKNVPGGNRINYALAILIAMTLARSGTNFQRIVILGEVIFLIVLAEALKGTSPTVKGFNINWIIAGFLVGWASAAMTYGTEYQGWLAWIVGTPLYYAGFITLDGVTVTRPTGVGWLAWIGKMGLGALFLLIILLILLFVIFRSEIRRRILTLGVAGAKERINAIIKNAKFLRESPEGREPQVFRENRILFHMLANFTTRSEITYRYWGFVEQGKRVGGHIYETKIKKFPDQRLLRKDIIATRSGGITSEGAHFEGWNKLNSAVVDLVNEFFWLTYWVYISAKLDFKPPTQYKIEGSQYQSIVSRAHDLSVKIETSRDQYKVRAEAFGGHHVLNAYKGIILNMTNVTGDVLEHYQKFAIPGAIFEGNLPGRDIGFYGPSFKAEGRRDPQTGIILPIHEVNQFGEYIQDITDQRDKFGNLPDPRDYKKPRKVKPEDIIDYPDYTNLMANVELDWMGLAEDIRYGLWHPESRTFEMYKQALAKAIYPEWADEQIPIMGPTGRIESSPSTGDEAFDMHALANPGLHPYWGRKTFDAKTPPDKNDPFHNPFPGVSSLGLAKYLEERVGLDMKDKAKAQEFMNKYPRDSAAPKKVTVRGEVKVKIGTRLGLRETQQETRG